ncbi:hypothetical protein TREAZ_0359 [Leadbettera azotonutricia ZAS-9]|uniref:Uncharacterized protein n=1 Tax=Leadbettera azotonutricia (strain ATCC BAA-888 / DSM 13862 / ZAS-9) TaxID=545695 RepID=F5YDG9_LEAAZ|nr:hypothetical protein TREAZ_0359 [Leadbettera azotonutricia ZAS-9]
MNFFFYDGRLVKYDFYTKDSSIVDEGKDENIKRKNNLMEGKNGNPI